MGKIDELVQIACKDIIADFEYDEAHPKPHHPDDLDDHLEEIAGACVRVILPEPDLKWVLEVVNERPELLRPYLRDMVLDAGSLVISGALKELQEFKRSVEERRSAVASPGRTP